MSQKLREKNIRIDSGQKLNYFDQKRSENPLKNCSEIIFTTGKSKMKKIIFDEKSLYNEL